VAKLLAYADCSLQLLTSQDPQLCDCNRIVDADAIPLAADQPNKQKEISLKADWKYVGVASFEMNSLFAVNGESIHNLDFLFIPSQYLQDIFHPPQA